MKNSESRSWRVQRLCILHSSFGPGWLSSPSRELQVRFGRDGQAVRYGVGSAAQDGQANRCRAGGVSHERRGRAPRRGPEAAASLQGGVYPAAQRVGARSGTRGRRRAVGARARPTTAEPAASQSARARRAARVVLDRLESAARRRLTHHRLRDASEGSAEPARHRAPVGARRSGRPRDATADVPANPATSSDTARGPHRSVSPRERLC